MTNPAPLEISGAQVIMYTVLDDRCRSTGNCRHIVGGRVALESIDALAICQYPGEQSYYLICCDRSWNEITDTLHTTLDDALKQAEFEYEGISTIWRRLA